MYGSVKNAAGGLPSPVSAVTWQISGGTPTDLATVQAAVVSMNGQDFYVARVAFENRPSGSTSVGRTANVLGLTKTPSTFGQAVRVNGMNATILASARGTLSTFTFGTADRGLTERVDLQLNLPGAPGPDTDGDGVPDWAEVVAGTNPADANSVYRALADVQPAPGGGLIIRWSSVAGKSYSVLRATNLAQPFSPLATNIPAIAPQNQFRDTTATGTGPYFYRVQVAE